MGLFVYTAIFFIVLFLLTVSYVRAESCLSIDVPPQAVLRNYDGDTFTIFTFAPGGEVDIRVNGIDTPERNKNEPGWQDARNFTSDWLAQGPFHVETCGEKTFGRIVAEISRGEERLDDALRAAGMEKQ